MDGEIVGRENDRHVSAARDMGWINAGLGLLTVSGETLILGGIVGAVLGAEDAARSVAVEESTVGLFGVVVTLLFALLIGGYCAGRMASQSAAKHGSLVPALALVVMFILAGTGALVGANFTESLSGMTLPGLPADAPQQSMGTILTVAGILALIFPFIGGALGDMWGAKTRQQRR